MQRPGRQAARRLNRGSAAKMTQLASKAVGLHHDVPPYAGGDWCLPVLHTEARIRLSPEYIAATSVHFNQGRAPPEAICEQAEQQALEQHGIPATPEWIQAYRFAARMLTKEERSEVFFLKANDKLFRPGVDLPGRAVAGAACRVTDGAAVDMAEVLATMPRAVLVASTGT